MIETLFVREHAIAKHKQAPLLNEREDYLRYLVANEVCRTSIQGTATILMDVIRVMNITNLRQVDKAEINVAALRWAQEQLVHRPQPGCRTSSGRFVRAARGWFRYHGLLCSATRPACRFDPLLEEFLKEMRYNLELSPTTIKVASTRTREFLRWLEGKHETLCSVRPEDIDDFLNAKRQMGWQPATVAGHCNALRGFLKFAESRGLCRPGLWRVISHPALRRRLARVVGPSWKDVRRLIAETNGTTPSEIRARAILLLCAIYGLRTSEITRLSLNDFDWRNETFTVRRSKMGRTQQLPIQFEVGEAIIQYLRSARPPCLCRNLFVTRFGPYRPLRNLWWVVSNRMKKLNIKSQNFGPHSLRHACATELLRKGTSLKDIADFLGHRGMESVSIYAKHDSRCLREVAAFRLGIVR